MAAEKNTKTQKVEHPYREKLLDVAKKNFDLGSGYFQERVILKEVARQLGIDRDREKSCELLTEFHKLFDGEKALFSQGLDLDNPRLPFMHLTQEGKRVLGKREYSPQ